VRGRRLRPFGLRDVLVWLVRQYLAAVRALDVPASSIRANIFWYSFRCFFSSLGFLGGSHEGRVRERYFCFSSDGWNGSMSGSLLRTGGSAALFDFGSGCFRDDDLVSPGCCRLTSCFRSYSDWNTSSASVIIFASGSRFVYVSSQVLVGCLMSCVGGEFSLFGEGIGECRDIDGAGDGFREDGSIVPATLGSGDGKLLFDGVRS
jgi:hypothetical protein